MITRSRKPLGDRTNASVDQRPSAKPSDDANGRTSVVAKDAVAAQTLSTGEKSEADSETEAWTSEGELEETDEEAAQLLHEYFERLEYRGIRVVPCEDIQFGQELGEGAFSVVRCGSVRNGKFQPSLLRLQFGQNIWQSRVVAAEYLAEPGGSHDEGKQKTLAGFEREAKMTTWAQGNEPGSNQSSSDIKLALAQQLADFLCRLRSAELVHLDIKPANILLEKAFDKSRGGVVRLKLTDFGEARFADNVTSYARCVGTRDRPSATELQTLLKEASKTYSAIPRAHEEKKKRAHFSVMKHFWHLKRIGNAAGDTALDNLVKDLKF
eukprot:gene6414-7689_t